MDRSMTHLLHQIKIESKRIAMILDAGTSRSVVKGAGFDFDQLREYEATDDYRMIDWKTSARCNQVLVKQFKEEKSRTFLLVLDVSWSMRFTSTKESKKELGSYLTLLIAHVGHFLNDNIGLILFSDRIECYIPPARGRNHLQAIIDAITRHASKGKQTNHRLLFEHIMSLAKKNWIITCVTDGVDTSCEQQLRILNKVHDVRMIIVSDEKEKKLADGPLIHMQDIETGTQILCNMSHNSAINKILTSRVEQCKKTVSSARVPTLWIDTHVPYIPKLIEFFKRNITVA